MPRAARVTAPTRIAAGLAGLVLAALVTTTGASPTAADTPATDTLDASTTPATPDLTDPDATTVGGTGAAGAGDADPLAATPVDPASKLRGDLAAMVAGEATLDPRIPPLVADHRPGELPYFVVLGASKSSDDRQRLLDAGARILREYRTVDAFAVASSPDVVLDVAAMERVAWLAPVELVFALEEPVVDQTRSHTADVGADEAWTSGVTGAGVRIAVLDTGVDPAHPDLDDLDFRRWSEPLSPPKVVDARDFNGGVCRPLQADGHGHGTHVAGIATGTGEGAPTSDDDARYAGIAPDAELAVAKVLTDAGAGINSDLVAAMEWAAMPEDLLGCAIGADIVNLSVGSEARPMRLNSDSDVDFVGFVLNRLAVEYGTLFVVAAGNSGPFVGSVLEAPGSAAQALSVAAAAKDWDLNNDDTQSGDSCSGWRHPASPSNGDNDCQGGTGDQPPSIGSFSSRGPSGDVWLRPDLAAPGYNIVSAQSTTGSGMAGNDLSRNTRDDPLYATATGTSMAAPATAGSAALLLQAYRDRHGSDPSGASGVDGMAAPPYALLRAALMNAAGGDLFESRWVLTPGAGVEFECPDPDPLFGLCGIVEIFTDFGSGSLTLYEARNRGADPYVGPLAEGAGKVDVGRAIAALRDGVVVYSVADAAEPVPGTGHRDFQGSWQVGPVVAGQTVEQRFVVHAAPGTGELTVHVAFTPGNPSDGSRAIDPVAWQVALPPPTPVAAGSDAFVDVSLAVPDDAPPGAHTGTILVTTSAGQSLRIPVFASVALHDPDRAAGAIAGSQASIDSATDVFAKGDTTWPSVLGAAGGTAADWLVYPVELGEALTELRVSVYDAAAGDEVYDLYLYDERLDLIATTHPFAAPGVTDTDADAARPPTTAAAPQVLAVADPDAGRHYLTVSRSRVGGTNPGDFGAFSLTFDEAGPVNAPPTAVAVADPTETTVGTPVTFDGTGSSDDRQSPGELTYAWDFGDGSAGEGSVVEHAYHAPGMYTAVLTVTDAEGAAGTDEVSVIVVADDGEPPSEGRVHGSGRWDVHPPGDHDHIKFGFDAKAHDDGLKGKLKLRDKDLGFEIEAKTITSLGDGAGADCAGITLDGVASFVFTAEGTWELSDDEGTGTFVACGVDNGKGKDAPPDVFAVRCATGCTYDSTARTADAGIDGGHVHLHDPIVAR